MTWSPNATFGALLDDRQQEPVYAVAISGHTTVYTTGAVDSASWTYKKILSIGDVDPGGVSVERGSFTLGALTFSLADRDSLALPVASIEDLYGRIVTLWMGFAGLAQTYWEEIGRYTIVSVSITEYGRYEFECVDPIPQLGRAIATSLGSTRPKAVREHASPGATTVYVENTTDLEIGQVVAIYDDDHDEPQMRTIDSLGTDVPGGGSSYWVVLATALSEPVYPATGHLVPAWAMAGNPINLLVRVLLDDFAVVGTIQTDFPITLYGTPATGDGLGVPTTVINQTAILAERDRALSTLDGFVYFAAREDNGRAWVENMLHGVASLLVTRDGLLSIRALTMPSVAGITPVTLDTSDADDWTWTRSFVDLYNIVSVEGDELARQTVELARVEDDTSIGYVGAKQLTVHSPWLRSGRSGTTAADTIGTRLLARATAGSETVELRCSLAQLGLEPGDVVFLTNPNLPNTAYAEAMSAIIGEVAESPIAPSQNATVLSVRCYPWARAGLIAPDTQVDYGSASGAEKATYAFACLDTGLMADGKIGYTWA